MELFLKLCLSRENQLSSLQQRPTSVWYLGAAKHNRNFQLLVTEMEQS